MWDELMPLIERHCGTIRAEANEIRTCIRDLRSELDHDQVQRTIYLVHKIKGGTGSLGFLSLSEAAHNLEYALRDLDEVNDHEPALANIRQLSIALQQHIFEMKPEKSNLLESAIMAQA